MTNHTKKGPLAGLTILELVGIGPGPFAGMLFADMGARVIAVDRGPAAIPHDVNRRGKESIILNLKDTADQAVLKKLIAKADGLFEGNRPGVLEKLGLGVDVMQAINPALVIGRMTGWGQTGPLAHTAGHDITYIARSGALGSIGLPGQAPVAPLNLIGDYGGGALFLVMGMLAALLEAKQTGKGRVVDAAMVDGAALMLSIFSSFQASGLWDGSRGGTMLSGHAPFYGTYETADGGYMAVGPIEPQFAVIFYDKLGLPELMNHHMSMPDWADMRAQVAGAFKSKTRAAWEEIFAGSDACVAPVLSINEAAEDPHMAARQSYVTVDGIKQPAPAPRFSGAVDDVMPITKAGADSDAIRRFAEEG